MVRKKIVKERFNVIWILVDSVRNYHVQADDRGKLEIMDKFGNISADFLHAVTSAPSTVMSISAMMTSLPAYYIGRNYEDFRFDPTTFVSLNNLLKSEGYQSFGLFRHWECREKLRNVFDMVGRKYWPSDFRHRNYWSNEDINRLLHNILSSRPASPIFVFLDYNCRFDPKISQTVENAIEMCQNFGYSYDNTIYILCSDHGYPDPSRGYTTEGLKKLGLTHDLILTDDNILIPLQIKYPGCHPTKIDTVVSSLDITPTILDILGFELDKKSLNQFRGQSLLPLIKGDKTKYEVRKVRCDGRFMLQSGRTTAIRGERYKYVYYHDKPEGENEAFYDILEDLLEEKNLISSDAADILNKISEFRTEFKRQEEDAVEFQFNLMLSMMNKSIAMVVGSKNGNNGIKVLIFGPCEANVGNMFSEAILRSFPGCVVDLLIDRQNLPRITTSKVRKKIGYDDIRNLREKNFIEHCKEQLDTEYDLLIIPINNLATKGYKLIFKAAKQIKSRKQIAIDYNMNVYKKHSRLFFYIKSFYSKREYIVREPLYLFELISVAVRMVIGKLSHKCN